MATSELATAVLQRVSSVVIGKSEALRLVLAGILAGGHVLLEDFPGLGKTLAARSFAQALGIEFTRAQFTPDLLPADLTGSFIYNQRIGEFEFREGPVFTGLLLADEINRATPKTQAALLEAMQERQVTVEGRTYPLPEPFFVLATQNPVELEGTFPLPEAQLDRFLLRIRIGYPTEQEEERILEPGRRGPVLADPDATAAALDLDGLRRAVHDVRIEPPVRRYLVALARATREHSDVQVGASPRAVEHLGDAVRAAALLDARAFALPDDVKAMASPVLAHRLVLTTDARIRDRRVEDVLAEVLAQVPVPVEFSSGA